jgi:deoxyadenosine/deoxycytidine kinase
VKIGFTGAHGTGKTTLAEALRATGKFDDWYFPPSSARLLFGDGINTDATPLSQILITMDRTNNIAGYDNVITDRTAIDSWAYTEYQMITVWAPNEVPTGYAAITNQYVDRAMNEIDLLVYFPAYWPPEGDGIRLTDPNYQLNIDDLIQKGMQRFYSGDIYVMRNESTEKRVERILSELNLT